VYPHLARVPEVDIAILVFGAGESQLIDLMNTCIARYPALKLFSLPRIADRPYIELGVRGEAGLAAEGLAFLREGVAAGGFVFEPRATLALD
jgi:hypothetical protein